MVHLPVDAALPAGLVAPSGFGLEQARQNNPSQPKALRLQGVVLPDGQVRQLWIGHGQIHTSPLPGACDLGSGYWIVPGLVDAHCHIGMGTHGSVFASREETEQQALCDRDAGTLLVRDTGVPVDNSWVDERDDLPRIIHAGRHIARPKRYLRHVGVEVEPADLVAEVERQAQGRRGPGLDDPAQGRNSPQWLKLVGDWIDRDKGDLAPLWPLDVARAAIARAHELGVRVTAHCFGEQSVAELVDAGIDGIEHGTGITSAVIEKMAQRQVALVPTMVNLANFPAIAASGEAKYPTYARHMRALYARHREALRSAREAGVPIFAGTDAGGMVPHGLIAAEVQSLATIGDAEFALGAASWRARSWLGHPSIQDGACADLVVYDADPLAHPQVVAHPRLVILRGVVRRG